MIEINSWKDAEETPDEMIEILRSIAQSLKNIEAALRKSTQEERGGLVAYLLEQIAMGGPDDVE